MHITNMTANRPLASRIQLTPTKFITTELPDSGWDLLAGYCHEHMN
jgi:hypothetical protein